MAKQKNNVVKKLSDVAKLHEFRNEEYGNAYKLHGDVMQALFPDGVDLSSADDQGRYALVSMIAGKLLRYTRNFQEGHQDSLDDMIAYAAMLSELDGAA